MSKRRKHRNEEEDHVDESWLIPYADILTLLLAVFIVLYAASSVNISKFNAIMGSFKTELTGQKEGTKSPDPAPTPAPQATQSQPITDQKLEELKQKLNAYINDNSLQNVISLQDTEKAIGVTLKDMILFDSGKAVVKENAFSTLDDLIGLVNTVDNPVSIEGYTDNVPIKSSSFQSNWELSAARASSVLHYFESHQIKPERLQFTAFGEYQPLYPNDSDEHRQANRRVTINVLRQK
ncbi:flagellar motor protein MotB [Ectobacillus sp. sgz5001026]|uniref:flagellar motor protein MotB n=1 Tax=Ectobacillus sp. sgz5001026 TaxID=3242473 RepID=UPI0036D3C1AF